MTGFRCHLLGRRHRLLLISGCKSGTYRAVRIVVLFAVTAPVSGRYGFSVRATQRGPLGSLRDCHGRTAANGLGG